MICTDLGPASWCNWSIKNILSVNYTVQNNHKYIWILSTALLCLCDGLLAQKRRVKSNSKSKPVFSTIMARFWSVTEVFFETHMIIHHHLRFSHFSSPWVKKLKRRQWIATYIYIYIYFFFYEFVRATSESADKNSFSRNSPSENSWFISKQ